MSTNMTPLAYRAASESAVLVDRSDRVRLVVTGPDRAKFLHNLTTQDVKRLPVGEGREAFVTSLQGKTLGFVTILATGDAILVHFDRAALPTILPHFQKYGLFDDISMEDVSAETFEYLLVGPKAGEIGRETGGLQPTAGELRHQSRQVAGSSVLLIQDGTMGRPGLRLVGALADRAAVLAESREVAGLVEVTPEAFEVLRIEGGFPLFGRDLTAENLPQEVARDAKAINFVKGCYLGQETVARIDALGHVNKLLRGLQLPGAVDPPAPGSVIEGDGKSVGTITSAAYSPGWGCVVALGYLRRSHAAAGTTVRVVGQAEGSPVEAVARDLPMLPV